MVMRWKEGRSGGYYVYLLWAGERRGFPFCGVSGNELARQVGQALAARLELAFSMYAPPRAAAPAATGTGLLRDARFWVVALLALTWLNSRVNLLLWEDRWAD